MRIAAFGRSLPIHALGGLEVHFLTMLEGLASHGHKVEAFTTRRRDGVRTERRANLVIHYLPWTVPGRYDGGYFGRSAQACLDRCREVPFDAILSESSAACGVLKRQTLLPKHIPVLWMAHGTWKGEIETKRRLGLWRPKQLVGTLICLNHWRRDRKYIRLADVVIACGRGLRDELVQVYDLDPDRVVSQSNGVDTTAFGPHDARRQKVRQELGINSEDVVLLISGRLHPEKGIRPFLELIAEMLIDFPRLRLVVVGDGPERQELEKTAAGLSLQDVVHFLGFRERAELPGLNNAADIFVFPSRRAEGQPISLIEAMASGLPVVANRAGWMASLIDDGVTGSLVDPGDDRAMMDEILILAKDARKRHAMGQAARKKAVAEFSIERAVGEVEGILERLVVGSDFR